jgi:arabinan endo-1,5-alpha-L-arabinosidase
VDASQSGEAIAGKGFNMINITACLSILLLAAAACLAEEPRMLELKGEDSVLGAHDPVMIRQNDTFYVFCTGGSVRSGNLIPIKKSRDLIHWESAGSVFQELPAWCAKEIPGTRGTWAPDISYFNGKYHVYYSVSTFGKNSSAIGLAINKTLDAGSPDYLWIDQGMVVRSREGETDWNAIDGNLVLEGEGNAWLAWGSFWSGIKMRRIDRSTGKLSSEDTTLYSIAARPRRGEHQSPPANGAIEAPFIVKKDNYWYLFVSFDFCCRGPRSTYRIMVGRSEAVTGPYVDKEGNPMLEGGGTELIAAGKDGQWVGPGHCAVVQDSSGDYLVFHAYRAQRTSGKPDSELKISTIVWEAGWPRVAPLP